MERERLALILNLAVENLCYLVDIRIEDEAIEETTYVPHLCRSICMDRVSIENLLVARDALAETLDKSLVDAAIEVGISVCVTLRIDILLGIFQRVKTERVLKVEGFLWSVGVVNQEMLESVIWQVPATIEELQWTCVNLFLLVLATLGACCAATYALCLLILLFLLGTMLVTYTTIYISKCRNTLTLIGHRVANVTIDGHIDNHRFVAVDSELTLVTAIIGLRITNNRRWKVKA